MKKYRNIQNAKNLLLEAKIKIKWNNYWDANIRIEDAIKLLSEFMEQNNKEDEHEQGY